jgi:hypothetical protein
MSLSHDGYGKDVVRKADKDAIIYGDEVTIDYGVGGACRIDAVVGDIAIEVESRTGKQIRGAVLDLICHGRPKKLLILLPEHMHSPAVEATRCENILKKFCPVDDIRVVLLKGSGRIQHLEEDAGVVARAIAELRAAETV